MKIEISKDALGDNALRHTVSASHVEVSIDPNVQAVALLEIEPNIESVIVETEVGDRAQLTLLIAQSPLATNQTISQSNKVGEGAKLHCQNITLGSQVEHAVVSHLNGAHAISSVDWIAYANGKEQQKLSARNVFNAANGGGEITMKAVAEDKAHVICNGMIDIGLEGGGTDTYLTEDVLMLDADCTVDAIPGLEIKTNDVKASHSATVSKVTSEDLFYLASRGIPQETARQMFVLGFLGELLQKVVLPHVSQNLQSQIENKYSSAL